MARSGKSLLLLTLVLNVYVSCKALNHPLQFHSRIKRGLGAGETSDYSLPSNLKPTFYNLTLTISDQPTFKGTVRIAFDVVEETDSIVLNVHNETIFTSSWKVYVASEIQKFAITETVVDGEKQTVTFKLNKALLKQQGVLLTISYRAVFSPYYNKRGFYKVNYYNKDVRDNLMITQFEPTEARTAFPCFDDPKYRSSFQLTIYHLPGQVSLFNTRLISSTPSSLKPFVVDVYEPSPPMPSYLVAFGVTDIANISDGGQVRLFARQALLGNMTFALSVAQPVLDALFNYTGVRYAMPKMDMVADYFKWPMAAMENWGLATFSENTLTYDENEDNSMVKYQVVNIIAHEFAHQWFGGLVTTESWQYLWLNEGFATLLSYEIVEMLYPDWLIAKTMAVETFSEVLRIDVGSPRAMSPSINGLRNKMDYFDYISYKKAGAVLRMTEHFLTTPVWRAGLNIYLTKNQYGTVNPEKLFSALQEAASQIGLYTVNETLQGWTRNPGYPLITVSKHSVTADGKVRYRISQTPYRLGKEAANNKWNVPLTYTTDKKLEFDPAKADRHWLYPSDPSTSELIVDTTGWVLFNVERIGYFRVNYDSESWQKLKEQLLLNMTVIPEVSRAQLVDDAIHLALSGHLQVEQAIDFLTFLRYEKGEEHWHHLMYLLHVEDSKEDTIDSDKIRTDFGRIYNSTFNPLL